MTLNVDKPNDQNQCNRQHERDHDIKSNSGDEVDEKKFILKGNLRRKLAM